MAASWVFLPCLALALLASAATAHNNLLHYSPSDLASEASLISLFDSWNAKHNKNYASSDPLQNAEKRKRFHIFRRNLMFIDSHNSKQSSASFRLSLNRFADLTHEEFLRSRRFGLKISVPRVGSGNQKNQMVSRGTTSYGDLPESIDWRALGAVTAPKDQGMCGKTVLNSLEMICFLQGKWDLTIYACMCVFDYVCVWSCIVFHAQSS